MPPLTDPERLTCYLNALANWRYDGFMTFSPLALAWLRREYPDYCPRDVHKLLFEHVEEGGVIDEQRETRERWRDLHEYHYDLRVPILGRRIYFETRLSYRDPNDPDDPTIDVVNIHDA